MTDTEAKPTERKTKTGWKARKVHKDVRLPSGQLVDITLPNLSQLLKAGEIPNALVDAAIEFHSATEISREMLEESFDFLCWAIPRTVVSPEITSEDVRDGEIPAEDIDLLAAFVARTSDMDAVGHHLGGLETNQDFRRFRGIRTIDEALADLS